MFWQHRMWLIVIVVYASNTSIPCRNPSCALGADPVAREKGDENPLVRYTIDEFAAAAKLRPAALAEHTYFGLLPFERFLPVPLSLDRLVEMDVEDLIVFSGPVTKEVSHNRPQARVEWAVAARLSSPSDLDALIRQWRRSLVLDDRNVDSEPSVFKIGQHQCFRIPSGSFIAPARTANELRFTDRDGKSKARGINSGDLYEYRSYLEGASQSSAIFTLDQLNDQSIIDGYLPLELQLNVFRADNSEREHSTGQILLRNPATGLRSIPISFQAKSHAYHRLNIPEKLTAVDGANKRPVDLLSEFVADGRLEIILKAMAPDVYFGVGNLDLNLRPRAFEYVYLNGPEVVIAQSLTTLKEMLNSRKAQSSMAQRLSKLAGELVIVADGRDEPRKIAIEQLMRSISGDKGVVFLGGALSSLTATLSVTDPTVASVIAEFRSRESAGQAKQQIVHRIRVAKLEAHGVDTPGIESYEGISAAIERVDAMMELSQVWFGFSFEFPPQGTPNVQSRKSWLLSMVDQALGNIRVESNDRVVTVAFIQPASLSRLPVSAEYALATMEETRARRLFERKQFDLGNEMFRRATNRFPHVPQIWCRRAHQLGYNMPAEFETYASRYVGVRAGVHVLLDGAEQNPHSTDLTWMVARFLEWEHSYHVPYRSLFSKDAALHKRLAKHVRIENAQSPDMDVDNWIVAKLLYERSIERHVQSRASSSIPSLMFFSGPARAQAGYADALTEAGNWNEASRAWKQAHNLYTEIGERTVLPGVRLNERESRLAEFGPEDDTVKRLQTQRNQIEYDYWLIRCALEQSDKVQLVRKLEDAGAHYVRQAKPKLAHGKYQQALHTLSAVSQEHPKKFWVIVGEFVQLASEYRTVASAIGKMPEAKLSSLLALIEKQRRFQERIPPQE